jgi:hypothetical protein
MTALASLALTIPAAFGVSFVLAHAWAVYCVSVNRRIGN